MPSTILSDNGVSSGSAGLKTTASNDGALVLQTTTSGGTATNVMYADTAQNVGFGVTPSAWGSSAKAIEVGSGASTSLSFNFSETNLSTNVYRINTGASLYKANGIAMLYSQSSAGHAWYNAASGTAGNTISFTQTMTLDASGKLGIGTTSPNSNGGSTAAVIHLHTPSTSAWSVSHYTNGTTGSGAGDGTLVGIIDSDAYVFNYESANLIFGTGAAERARITSSGSFLVGTTTALDGGSTFVTSDATSALSANRQTSTAAYGVFGSYSSIGGANSLKSYTRADGGLANYSANNVNLSDERLKKDIAPAGSYLAKICAIPVKTFRYKDQEETEDLTLGVIAQEVQQIAPELVSRDGFGLSEEDKQDYLSIYQTDLQYALMKALQELKAEFDAYKATHP